MGALAVPVNANGARRQMQFPPYHITEVGFFYVYLSYEGEGANWVYFDDLKITHTQTNIIQYNEYYTFGMLSPKSWTRDDASNNYLYNQGGELNTTTGIYDLFFRNYDPATGRFFQIDPKAMLDPFTSAYVYAGNNPGVWNDPLGDIKVETNDEHTVAEFGYFNEFVGSAFGGGAGGGGGGYGASWAGRYAVGGGNHWSDGSRYEDWDPNAGSDLFRQGLAAKEGGAPIAYHSGEWHGTGDVVTGVKDGKLVYWQDRNYVSYEYYEKDGKTHRRGTVNVTAVMVIAQQGADCWWCDDQGTILFNHWRNGKGEELFLNDPKVWGDYMRAHAGLRQAIEQEIAGKHQNKPGPFAGVMKYDFGGGYMTGYQMLGGSNAFVGGLSYSGEVTVSGDYVHYYVNLVWNDIMDPIDSWDDKFGAWLLPGSPYTVHINWTYNFGGVTLDQK